MRGENAIACRTGVIRKKIAPVLQTKNAKKNATEVSGQERASVTCKASNWPQARYLPVLFEHNCSSSSPTNFRAKETACSL